MLRRLLLALCLCSIVLPATSASAVDTEIKNKGLYISPLRHYITLDAGQSVTRAFTVANLTDQPMAITTDIERFSVIDYSYDYQFDAPLNDWVSLVNQQFSLKPYESRDVVFQVAPPPSAAPGGYYYTLFAAATFTNGSTNSTLRAASLVYLTVNGSISRTSVVTGDRLPSLVIRPSITYALDVKNTGNAHYFALLSAKVEGLWYQNAPNGTSQLLMPNAVRHLEASMPAPLLPGVYKFTYTIAPDDGVAYASSRYFVYLPLWSLIILGFLILFVGSRLYRRWRNRTAAPQSDTTSK